MPTCPKCGKRYDDGAIYCLQDGTRLSDGSAVKEAVPVEELSTGAVLGNYRLVRKLGAGGMGVVFEAEHTLLGRRMALKALNSKSAANPISVQRFFAEARAASQIGHEHIVEISDFVDGDDYKYYVMELLKGETLASLMIRDTYQPLGRVYSIAAQVASALAAVHDAGIVHRDLKPDNIFLISRARQLDYVKLLDFGVAKLLHGDDEERNVKTQVGALIGTPAYMAPEQLEGEPVDARADVFSFGVILYLMATGRRPFKGRSVTELMLEQDAGPPPRPGNVVEPPREIPTVFDDLILRCLSIDKRARPQTMHEVEAHLSSLLDSTIADDVWADEDGVHPSRHADEPVTAPDKPGAGAPSSLTETVDEWPIPDTVTDKGVAPTIDEAVGIRPGKDTTTQMTSRAIERRITGRAQVERGGWGRLLVGVLAMLALGAAGAWWLTRGQGAETPAQVQIDVTSRPSAVPVFQAGTDRVLGTTPFTLVLDRGAEEWLVEFRLPGHESLIVPVSAEQDGRCFAELDPITAPAETAAPPARDAGATEDRGRSVVVPTGDKIDAGVAPPSIPSPRSPRPQKRGRKKKYQPDDLVDPFSS